MSAGACSIWNVDEVVAGRGSDATSARSPSKVGGRSVPASVDGAHDSPASGEAAAMRGSEGEWVAVSHERGGGDAGPWLGCGIGANPGEGDGRSFRSNEVDGGGLLSRVAPDPEEGKEGPATCDLASVRRNEKSMEVGPCSTSNADARHEEGPALHDSASARRGSEVDGGRSVVHVEGHWKAMRCTAWERSGVSSRRRAEPSFAGTGLTEVCATCHDIGLKRGWTSRRRVLVAPRR